MTELAGPSLTRSRFVLLEKPLAHPGICKVCGAAHKPVIDFGASDDDGAIYFCIDCLTEVAKGALGLVDASELDEARLTINELQEQLNRPGELLNEYIGNLHTLHDGFISSLVNIPSVDASKVETVHASSLGTGYGEISDPGPREQDTDKSSSGERSASVPGNSDSPGTVFKL